MGSSILWLVGVVVILVVLAVLKGMWAKGKGQNLPYEKESALFSPAERSFLGVLEQAVGNEFRIMGKVRLGDVVKVKAGVDKSLKYAAFNRIQSKHLDFVACDPNDLSVQFVVELDDKSHERQDRKNRDVFVDKVMEVTGIPIIHFAVKASYSIQEVRATLVARLNPPETAPSTAVVPEVPVPVAKQTATTSEDPQCPTCGATMIRRRTSKGQNAGNEFWGCSSYPKCRQILPIQGS